MSVIWGRSGGKKITKAIALLYPSYSDVLVHTGSAIGPTWNNYDENKMDISGTITAIELGTYTTVFTPKEGYCWEDNTVTPYSVTWIICEGFCAVPTQKGTLYYAGGTTISLTWNNYDANKMSISGTTTGKYVGTYTAVFTLKNNYLWEDGTTASKKVSWTISVAQPKVVVTPNPVTISLSKDAAGVKVVTKCTNGPFRPDGLRFPVDKYMEASIGDIIDSTSRYILIIPKAVGTGYFRSRTSTITTNGVLQSESGEVEVKVIVTA
jgi:hypothetical protein